MRLPDFYIIGAPKCGTTALYHYLSQHPSIFMPDIKEPHYFCKDFPDYQRVRDLASYSALFAGAPASAMLGEASVWYLFSEAAVSEIVKLRPDAKFIILLRNPVDVVQSLHGQMLIGLSEDILDLKQAWKVQSERAQGKRLPLHCMEPRHLQYGLACSFSHQVERVLSIVGKERVQILISEEFFAEPHKQYQKILEFLGLLPQDVTQFGSINVGRRPARPRIHQILARPPALLQPLVVRLRALSRRYKLHLGTPFHAMGRLLMNLQEKDRPKLDTGFEQELYEFFNEDIAKLEGILGRDINVWKHPPHEVQAD